MLTSTPTARVNANNVTVRKDKTTKSDALTTLSLGANVEILSTHTTTNTDCSTNVWYKISYYTNKTDGVSSMCRIPEGLFEWVEDKLSE